MNNCDYTNNSMKSNTGHTAHIEAEWRKYSVQYYEHILCCKKCNPHIGAFCEIGKKVEKRV